ncbi:MAG: MucR family transcriptional regulator [Proteobacteria bacterium]|nr:MucR family transcriptional regulator [Pseudomonadota bacterium]
MPESENDTSSLELVSKIVSAYVSKNSLPPGELPQLIRTVHEALKSPDQAAAKPEPAVSIKQSVKPEYIVCLDDGKKLKMLKRHLRSAYNMSPDEYRQKWGLPADYPMVAPKYAALRSKLAKKIGLGRKTGTKMKARRKARV